jgi:dihydropyrimidinase
MKTLLKGGTVVTASDIMAADVLIDGETIAAIGRDLGPADTEIDAGGLYVFPGGIDEHVHFNLPFMGTNSAPWETETVAAAIGGTTTVVDFAMQTLGAGLFDAIHAWREEKADGRTAIDYGLHAGVIDLRPDVMDEIPRVVEYGIPTLKCFMAYKGALMIDDATMFRLLQRARTLGALVLVHQENGDVVDILQKELVGQGKLEPRWHAVSRPPQCEGEAAGRAIALAEMAGAPLFIVHVTTAQCVDQMRRARARGLPVFGETCPQYLTLDEEYLALPDFEGAKYVCSPPLRERSHQDALWAGLADGTLQAVGTDHCAFTFVEQKQLGRESFVLIPNGLPAVEERLALLFTCGVLPGRISLNRFVDLISTGPAKVQNLYPKKGAIAPGSDADLVLFDPKEEWTMGVGTAHTSVDYSAWEGWRMQGRVRTVLLRGQVIVRDGQYVGSLSDGRFVERRPYGFAYGEDLPLPAADVTSEVEQVRPEPGILQEAGIQAEP